MVRVVDGPVYLYAQIHQHSYCSHAQSKLRRIFIEQYIRSAASNKNRQVSCQFHILTRKVAADSSDEVN